MADPGSAYCKDHMPPPAHKEADPFYLSPAWRSFRGWFISHHPLCSECERHGETVQGVIVDHIIELKDGGEPFDEGNAQTLCAACHNRKTAKERRKRGRVVYEYEKNHQIGTKSNRAA